MVAFGISADRLPTPLQVHGTDQPRHGRDSPQFPGQRARRTSPAGLDSANLGRR